MRCRLNCVCSMANLLALATLILFSSVGCGRTPSVATGDGEKIPAEFAIPEGKPDEIMKFIQDLSERRPKISSRAEQLEFMVNVQKAMIRAGDKILAQNTEDVNYGKAATLKILGTLRLAMAYGQDSPKFDGLAKDAIKVIDRLRKDKRPVVVKVANEFWIAGCALNVKSFSEVDRTQLGNDAIKKAVDSKLSQDAVGNVMLLADQLAEIGQNESAATLCDRLEIAFSKSKEEKTRNYAHGFKAKAQRFRLPGSQLELEGKLLGGGQLDWESYRGKVVLVDFWATWCDPCVADLPNVKAQYDKYHSRGFEVVAVSLDHDLKQLEKFVKQAEFPWVQVFDEEVQVAGKRSSPMSVKYGVTSIPTAFLVDKDGKVVSVEARGEELDQLLEKLLGTAN